jgi:hypothetical protein
MHACHDDESFTCYQVLSVILIFARFSVDPYARLVWSTLPVSAAPCQRSLCLLQCFVPAADHLYLQCLSAVQVSCVSHVEMVPQIRIHACLNFQIF